jgi:hypothetical protein
MAQQMAPHVEERPRGDGPPPPAYTPPVYSPPAYPQPYQQPYQPYPTSPPPSDAQRTEQKWLTRCFVLAIVSLGLFIPLLGIAQAVATQYAVGFGGFLVAAAIPALLLVFVNVAFMVGTRPRR